MTARAITISEGKPEPLGISAEQDGVNVAVVSENAEAIFFCLFDQAGEKELERLRLPQKNGYVHSGFVAGVRPGDRYGFRADGPYDPARGHWFDPAKLLVDPYARSLDRPFALRRELSAPRSAEIDTARFVPKAIIPASHADVAHNAMPREPRFIYEVAVKAFTRKHPEVPERLRGTVAALAEPPVIDYLTKLGVGTVELMPLAAWIDERHLPAHGLSNAWGYNPVVFMAPEPRLAPGGFAEIKSAVDALHDAGIGVILDAVFNHTGESDEKGPTLSLRGLDNALYYRLAEDGGFINDAGTGNTLATDRAPVIRLVVDAMRAWAIATGLDGFRLDLAAILGRTVNGFARECPFFAAIESDPLLGRLTIIAEPWDVGPGGYQLGNFPPRWREWNDRYRDDVRRFWRGDEGIVGSLATRIAGSSDIFHGRGRRPSSSVNFVAAHDGFTLNDLVTYERKHNEANGEGNRDGTDANFSWNNGAEGPSDAPAVVEARRRDLRGMLATLFVSRGLPMLAAGDEFRRTQGGNNNAYAQDNDLTWLDWNAADRELSAFVADLIRLREARPSLSADAFLTGAPLDSSGVPDVVWLSPRGREMAVEDWTRPDNRVLGAALYTPPSERREADRTSIWVNAGWEASPAWLPPPRAGHGWVLAIDTSRAGAQFAEPAQSRIEIPPRTVLVFAEQPRPD